jgi:hypothetical protein
MAYGRITKLPYIGDTNKNFTTHEVSFTAIPDPVPKPDVVPLWIFVLAACAGALILLLLIYLLYKVSFIFDNFFVVELKFLLIHHSADSSSATVLKDRLTSDNR